jgi:nitrogen fixation NifU-like protein
MRPNLSGKGTKVYDDLVMDHIKNARNYRVLDDADRRAEGTNPMCGDQMLVYLKLDGERLSDLAFQCTCCGISMASASMMTEAMKGAAVEDAIRSARELIAMLESGAEPAGPEPVERLAMIDTVKRFPARTRCAVLPWRTLAEALENRVA